MRCKTRQNRKFDSLLRERDTNFPNTNRWVVNVSSKALTDPQKLLLAKGMNLAPTPRLSGSDTPSMVATVEAAIMRCGVDADSVRWLVF
jgi:hypothetical protein